MKSVNLGLGVYLSHVKIITNIKQIGESYWKYYLVNLSSSTYLHLTFYWIYLQYFSDQFHIYIYAWKPNHFFTKVNFPTIIIFNQYNHITVVLPGLRQISQGDHELWMIRHKKLRLLICYTAIYLSIYMIIYKWLVC